MRFMHLYFVVLAALLSVAMASDALHVPLRKRAHGGLRLINRDGQMTDVVNMAALRRSINHVSRRYGSEEEDTVEKRWVKASILDKEFNMDFARQDDEVHNNLLKGLADMVGNILPGIKGKTDGANTANVAQSKSKSRLSSAGNGRYTGPAGSASDKDPLTDNVSGGTDIEFVGDLTIGTPPQRFPINPDTGSSDLWVVDQSCTAEDCGPNSRGKFHDEKSSTYEPIDSPKFELQYGIGNVDGRYARETVKFGQITLQKQIIGLANHTSPDWKDDLASGVLGLGFRSISSNNQRPVIQNLASQGNLKRKVISFAFGRYLSGTQKRSEMLIGDWNRSLYKGKLSWYAVTRAAYWQASVKSFGAGGKAGVQNADGIFDTGTSLIAAPANVAATFYKGVKGARLSSDGSYYTYPCSTNINAKLTMPDGKAFTLNEQDMNLGKDTPNSSRCVGAVVVASTPGQIIYGLAALKNFYSVYDFEQNRIGMAPYTF